MKKISIYQYEGTNIHDITLFDLNAEEIELYSVQGLRSYSEIISAIDNLINQFNLQPNDKIVNYYFDSEEYLKEIVKETVHEYLS
jgi:hypothetical protein